MKSLFWRRHPNFQKVERLKQPHEHRSGDIQISKKWNVSISQIHFLLFDKKCGNFVQKYNFMPEISRFLGIVIYLFPDDHYPPHFHAKYGDDKVMIDINTGEIIEGTMTRRALRLIQDWAELHKTELLEDFELLRQENKTYFTIEPLK